MFNVLRKLLLVSLFASAPLVIANTGPSRLSQVELPEYLEDRQLSSSQYTQVDDLSAVDEAFYIPLNEADTRIAENASLRLYFNAETTTFKVENIDSGYVFASSIENPDAGTFNGLLESAVGLDFIRTDRNYDLRENVGLNETIHTVNTAVIPGGLRLDIEVGGFCATRACERLYPAYLAGNYTLEEMLDVGFTNIDIAFQMNVTLEERGVRVEVPYESIQENGEFVRLASLILLPGFGATEMDLIPGYMMIPDGAGALIRYEDNDGAYLSPYQAPFYGEDLGIPSNRLNVSNYTLSLPVFGAVHGVYQHGFLGFIESGAMSARLMVYPNGSLNQPYNLMFAKYDYRRVYRQSFTTDRSAGAPRELQTLFSDIAVTYDLLEGSEAHYIGMARTTQEKLELTRITQTEVPLHVTYLMADSEASFFGATLVEMSTPESILKMHQRLIDANIPLIDVALMGWNDGGYSGHLPVAYDLENALGRTRSYETLFATLNETGAISLINDYLFAGEASDASYRRDMVSGVDRFKLEYNCASCVYETTGILSAARALEMLEDDLDQLDAANVDYMDASIGHTLTTMYQGGLISRETTAKIYQTMVQTGRLNVSVPSGYLLPYLDKAYYIPTYHSSLEYFDDLIPFMSTVLNGVMPLYSSYMNFNSIGETGLLKLIDFGIYPSYILSDQPTSRLKNTDISYFYTTEFDRWETSIIDDYTFIAEAMAPTLNAQVLSRDVIAQGVVKKVFDNGVIQYINYQSKPVQIDGVEIAALNVTTLRGTP